MELLDNHVREQMTLATTGFERHSKVTRREKVLREMDRIVPWKRLRQIVKPYYFKGDGVGRRPIELERVLRIYFLQQWFNLSGPGVEDALYDMLSMRAFARIDLGQAGVPGETTVYELRHLLEKHELGKKLFAEVNRHLADCGIVVSGGTIVDATIINAPSSTKNKEKARDPEMHQTKKGNHWYFGMKAHISADSRHRIVHTIVATAANVHDNCSRCHVQPGWPELRSINQACPNVLPTLPRPGMPLRIARAHAQTSISSLISRRVSYA